MFNHARTGRSSPIAVLPGPTAACSHTIASQLVYETCTRPGSLDVLRLAYLGEHPCRPPLLSPAPASIRSGQPFGLSRVHSSGSGRNRTALEGDGQLPRARQAPEEPSSEKGRCWPTGQDNHHRTIFTTRSACALRLDNVRPDQHQPEHRHCLPIDACRARENRSERGSARAISRWISIFSVGSQTQQCPTPPQGPSLFSSLLRPFVPVPRYYE